MILELTLTVQFECLLWYCRTLALRQLFTNLRTSTEHGVELKDQRCSENYLGIRTWTGPDCGLNTTKKHQGAYDVEGAYERMAAIYVTKSIINVLRIICTKLLTFGCREKFDIDLIRIHEDKVATGYTLSHTACAPALYTHLYTRTSQKNQ